MNAAASSSAFLSAAFPHAHSLRLKPPARSPPLLVASSYPRRRRQRRRRLSRPFTSDPSPSSSTDNPDISLSIDLDSLSDRTASILTGVVRSSTLGIRRFLASGADALDDLCTSVRVEPGRNLVISCRRSSVRFLGETFVFGIALFVAVRAVLGFWRRLGFGSGGRGVVVVRRDRSLGGREVVVGTRRAENERGGKDKSRFSVNSLVSDVEGLERRVGRDFMGKWARKKDRLPEWWPEPVPKMADWAEDVELKREADRLVREITDNRVSGKDYNADDIMQLRRICKVSGARVSFGTANERDSFYRASVDFVLNMCSRSMQPATAVQIAGEEAKQFITGLANNIGLDNVRAATIIRAAVAARTRSCFLQTWAFEVQGKRTEALEELSKICRIFEKFPPETHSPEMEMVASGLMKILGIEQRDRLLALFREVCGPECLMIAEDALGLGLDS